MNRLIPVLVLGALFRVASLGHASVITITSPFVGNLTETWESFQNYVVAGPLPNPTVIMGGGALISNLNMNVYEPGAGPSPTYYPRWGLGDSGLAQVSDGAKGLGVYGDASTSITFTTPVSNFGAFWAESSVGTSESNPASVTVSFFDVFDDPIDVVTFTYNHTQTHDGGLDWHGWSSPIGIKRVVFESSSWYPQAIAVDGLQADTVPEPTTLVLWSGLGAMWLIAAWRRRKRQAA